jgi:hypothetical protein
MCRANLPLFSGSKMRVSADIREPNIKGGMPTHHCAARKRYDAARTRTMRDRPLYPPLPACCCVAANSRSGPKADMAILIGLVQTEPLPLAQRTSLLSTEQ